MRETQKDIIKKQLNEFGFVSRNWCLENYITRLSAYILDFKKEGLDFEAKWVNGDYVYYIKKEPVQQVLV